MLNGTTGFTRWFAAAALTAAIGRVAAAAPVTYSVRPGPGQSVRFQASTNFEHYAGHTDQVTGTVRCEPEHPAAAPFAQFTVRMGSLDTGNGSRDSNMRRRYLETDKYPDAVFTLTRLDAPAGEAPLAPGKPQTGVARGTFALHGVTREITPVVTVTRERDAAGRDTLHVTSRFVVRLKDYEIDAPRILFAVVRQEQTVLVDVRGAAQQK